MKFQNFSYLPKFYDERKEVKLIIHGWMSSSKEDFPLELKDAYLNKSDVNVIIVDWNSVAG